MSSSVEVVKDYLDINDIKKAHKNGKLRASQHAQSKAAAEDINIQDYYQALFFIRPHYERGFQDIDTGLPGYIATVEMAGRNIRAVFVKNDAVLEPDTIVIKTIHEYDPNFQAKREEIKSKLWDSAINHPPLPAPEPVELMKTCDTCRHLKRLMGKGFCEAHKISKLTAEGVISISMLIAESGVSCCGSHDEQA
jgi:hypothetical protein